MEHVEAQTMRLLGTVPSSEVKSVAVHFQAGDVLYGRLRPYLNKVLRPLFEGLSSAEFIVFPPSPALDQQFLQHVLNSAPFVSFASHLNEGDRPRVDFDQLGAFELALPPFPEQRRIVAEIEKQFTRVDPSRDALEASLKKLDKLISASIIRACLLSNPGEIRFQPIASVGGVTLGRQRAPKHHSGPSMRPYLRVANIYEDRIETRDIKQMNFTDAEFERYRLEEGDVLLNEGQSLELVGRPAIYRGEVPACCFQNTLVRFKASRDVIPEYALYVFRAWLRAGEFQKIARWTTTMAHLGAERFAAMPFPLRPKSSQEAIVEYLDASLSSIAHLAGEIKTASARAARLRQAILKGAFEGKLVAQDPNEEPASVLLDRIRYTRTNAPVRGTTRKREVHA
jgi:type I restriction enzyme S subunit